MMSDDNRRDEEVMFDDDSREVGRSAASPAFAHASPTYLMCPPNHFAISYEINAWMHLNVQPDPDRAQAEWQSLAQRIEQAGGKVHMLEPVPGLSDMVFTTDTGLVHDGRFVRGHFRYPERRPEVSQCSRWLEQRGADVIDLGFHHGQYLEGGDLAVFGRYLVGGYGFRSTRTAHALVARALGLNLLPIALVDPCLYHMDMSFCTLDDRHAIIAPCAWDRATCQRVARVVPEPLVLERDEALTFCANAVIVGTTVIMPACPPRVGRTLEAWGFDVCVCPVREFLKAGGAAHCLCLSLSS